MNFNRRHDMGSMSMDMASMTMAMATSTMDMAMETTAGSMNHGDSEMMGMHMWFTTQFKDYPVLFRDLKASNKGEAFGIFLLLFVVAILSRLLEFLRNYLEEVVWSNKNFIEFENGVVSHSANLQPALSSQQDQVHCSMDKNSVDEQVSNSINSNENSVKNNNNLSFASKFFRDIIRLILCIVPDLFGYALMLAAMTYTLTYFFAVVLGSGIGRFVSERLMERFRLKQTRNTRNTKSCC
ncbi:unnamed protein product [Candida verbasci]|uniref:Copper transport protein n=1 Tax=Candida verbasci TaxID=1227364 RepID=A0A9W4U0I4_9ASCO|nr:unnamed protein product [Candida verbasci]